MDLQFKKYNIGYNKWGSDQNLDWKNEQKMTSSILWQSISLLQLSRRLTTWSYWVLVCPNILSIFHLKRKGHMLWVFSLVIPSVLQDMPGFRPRSLGYLVYAWQTDAAVICSATGHWHYSQHYELKTCWHSFYSHNSTVNILGRGGGGTLVAPLRVCYGIRNQEQIL